MKRFFSLLLCLMLGLTFFTACGGNSTEGSNSLGGSSDGAGDSSGEVTNLKEIDLYLIGGQSNAAGATNHKGMLKETFTNVGYAGQTSRDFKTGATSNINNVDDFNKFLWEVKQGYGELAERVGPEYGIAKAIDGKYTGEKKAFIFKSAAGATPLIANIVNNYGSWLSRSEWGDDYTPENTTTGIGWQYYSFVENFRSVYTQFTSNGYKPVIKGMAWMQGCSDLGAHRQYKGALESLITDLRTDLYQITGDESTKKMPFVIGLLPTTFSVHNNTLVPPMRAVQQQVADSLENVKTIETDDFILVNADGTINGSDAFHFNYNDCAALGVRFGNKILEMNGML